MLQYKLQNKRRVLFTLLLAALIVCMGGFGTYLELVSTENQVIGELERNLDARARNGVTSLAVWYDRLRGQIDRVGSTDLFRLYALEATNPDQSSKDVTDDLTARAPIIEDQLKNFIGYTSFLSASVLDASGRQLLSTDKTALALTPELQAAIANVMETGEFTSAGSRLTKNGAVVDLLQPVFAPAYLDGNKKVPVAVLMATAELHGIIQELQQGVVTSRGENRFLLIVQPDKQLALFSENSAPVLLPDWKATETGLPLDIRELPGGDPVYTYGLPVPAMPLLLTQSMNIGLVQEELSNHKRQVLAVAALCMGVPLVTLLGVWWWLVGRRERAFSGEIKGLYTTVEEQKQLLASIDNTLPGGVVLTSSSGIIRHANRSFGLLCNHGEASLPGLSLPFLFKSPVREIIANTLKVAQETGKLATEEFRLDLKIAQDTVAPQTATPQAGTDPDQNVAPEDTAAPSTTTEIHYYRMTSTPYRDSENTMVGAVSVFNDVTEFTLAKEQNQRLHDQTIAVFTRAIEAVDPYLRGQSDLTETLAQQLVTDLHLSPEDYQTVSLASRLFQIGLIQVPRTILNKEQTLTSEERQLLEQHVTFARNVLEDLKLELPVLPAICQMYERLDGSGYPDRLAGDSIGIHGRILAVANTLCAIMQPRSYRNAKTKDVALQILSSPAYDQTVVAALARFLNTLEGKTFIQRMQPAPHVTEV